MPEVGSEAKGARYARPRNNSGPVRQDTERPDRFADHGFPGRPDRVVSNQSDPTTRRRLISPDNRKLLAAVLGVLLAVFALVFSNVAANHAPRPHEVPVGIVGSPHLVATVRGELQFRVPGGYEVSGYDSLAAAKTAILHRSVYGAFQPGPHPVLLVASAASVAVAQLLERTFGPVVSATAESLTVVDVVPLPRSDSGGATAFSALLSLILAGLLGSSIVYAFTQHRSETVRVVATIGIAVVAGLLTALVTNVIVAAFPRHFLTVWGLATLFVLAIGLPIAAFQVMFGMGGTAIGWVLFLVIGNPASGGSSAPQLLPTFWRALSQRLTPGAAATAMRDAVYFNGHGSTQAVVVLTIYAVAGGALAMIMYRVRLLAGHRPVTAGVEAER